MEPVAGPWMRCCERNSPVSVCSLLICRGIFRAGHCATSFDLCIPCLHSVEHDPDHVFVKFSRRLDIMLFKEMCVLSRVSACLEKSCCSSLTLQRNLFVVLMRSLQLGTAKQEPLLAFSMYR